MRPVKITPCQSIIVNYEDGKTDRFEVSSSEADRSMAIIYNGEELGWIARSLSEPGLIVMNLDGEIIHTKIMADAVRFLMFGERP